jgi:hypothetical protein
VKARCHVLIGIFAGIVLLVFVATAVALHPG